MSIFDELFDGFQIGGVVLLAAITVGAIWVSWFVDIPSLTGDSKGFPLSIKLGVSILLPIFTYLLIKNKEWTQGMVDGMSKGKR